MTQETRAKLSSLFSSVQQTFLSIFCVSGPRVPKAEKHGPHPLGKHRNTHVLSLYTINAMAVWVSRF